MSFEYSVIIPAYNAETTIERCLHSVVNNSYDNYEIIIVNDGSDDSTLELLHEFKKKNKNTSITIINQENKGVSAARNEGLRKAKGKYICFVDSDDYVSKTFFEEMNHIPYEVEYAIFSNVFVNVKLKEKVKESRYYQDSLKKAIAIRTAIIDGTINAPTSKRYIKDIIDENNILFPENISISEDIVFNILYSLHINNIYFSSLPIYCFDTSNQGSLSRKPKEQAWLDSQFEMGRDIILKELNQAIIKDSNYITVLEGVNFYEYREIYAVAKRMIESNISRKDRINTIKEKCKCLLNKKLSFPKISLCYLMYLPIKLNCCRLIDAIAMLKVALKNF